MTEWCNYHTLGAFRGKSRDYDEKKLRFQTLLKFFSRWFKVVVRALKMGKMPVKALVMGRGYFGH